MPTPLFRRPHPDPSPWKNLLFRGLGYPDLRSQARGRAVFRLLDLPPGSRVLDVGCGMGNYSYELMSRGYDVVSVDLMKGISRSTILRVRETFRKGGKEFRFMGADVCHLPFLDGAFDGVLCIEVLEHIPDDEAALQEVRRVLRPGGALILSSPATGFHRGRFKGLLRWLYLHTPLGRLPVWNRPGLFEREMMAAKSHLREYDLEGLRLRCARSGLAVEAHRWVFRAFSALPVEMHHAFRPLQSLLLWAPVSVLTLPLILFDEALPGTGTSIAIRARRAGDDAGAMRSPPRGVSIPLG